MKQFSDDKDYHEMFDSILHNSHFTAFFRPVINTKINCLYGIDTSVRLQSNDSKNNNYVSPGEFLNAMEQSGKIIHITKQLLLQIESSVAANEKAKQLRLYFFIKISPPHLFNDNIIEFSENCISTAKRLAQSGGALVIEVNSRISFEQIHKLKLLHALTAVQKNISFAIADFGIGYANIEMLLGFNFDFIKIHHSLFFTSVDSVTVNTFADDLLNSLNRQKTNIIITGIRSEHHLYYFMNKGLSLFQGQLFSPPVACRDFSFLL